MEILILVILSIITLKWFEAYKPFEYLGFLILTLSGCYLILTSQGFLINHFTYTDLDSRTKMFIAGCGFYFLSMACLLFVTFLRHKKKL